MKIGIMTFYYNSLNCGGNLQAYALAKFLHRNGYEAEQISYDYLSTPNDLNIHQPEICTKIEKKQLQISSVGIQKILRFLKKKAYTKKFNMVVCERKKAFKHFNEDLIPHGNIVYNNQNIKNSNDFYDVFITGSDQVWNLKYTKSAYFLDFVKKGKTKISYAASMALDELSENQQMFVGDKIKDYCAISVREQKSVDLLSAILDSDIHLVVDPTLLLSADEWDEVCSERVYSGEYVFAYFLGTNKEARKIAQQFAKRKHLKLIFAPFANGQMNVWDIGYGDVQIKCFSPETFLSLIKNANYVFTDSFHATVFSFTYEKQYFVFSRNAENEMSARIEHLVGLFEQDNRFYYGDKLSLDYVLSQNPLDYSKRPMGLITKVKESSDFLLKSLEAINLE